MKIGDIAEKVRSKNAGPFWITVDVFCGSADAYARIVKALENQALAALFATPLQTMKRFDIADLHVIKISYPRPAVQGSRADRDMHGAAAAVLLAELRI